MNTTQKLVLDYHTQGLDDSQISSLTGYSKEWIRKTRNDLKLSAPTRKRKQENLQKMLELQNLKLTDKQIAKELGMDYRTISRYRSVLNIPAYMPENVYSCETDRIKGYMIRNTKFMAKRRNIEFNLHYTDIELPEHCPLLGIKLTFRSESNGNHSSHATLDRIDNTKGYIKGNIIVMSRLANAMKNCADFDQLVKFSDNIKLLINNYKMQDALGSITDIFPEINILKT
jgi:hypothetical protein